MRELRVGKMDDNLYQVRTASGQHYRWVRGWIEATRTARWIGGYIK